jgi:methanesulfonate monooxygenase small subunit
MDRPFSLERVSALIYTGCRLLDEERFEEWLKLCQPGFTFRITAFSDELAKQVVWMRQDRAGLATIFANVKRQERHTGRLRRHVCMVALEEASANGTALVRSSLAVYHTELNGVTQLYAIGNYCDKVIAEGDVLRLAEREVALDTRRLAFGPHLPI